MEFKKRKKIDVLQPCCGGSLERKHQQRKIAISNEKEDSLQPCCGGGSMVTCISNGDAIDWKGKKQLTALRRV